MMEQLYGMNPRNVYVYGENVYSFLESVFGGDYPDGDVDVTLLLSAGADEEKREMLRQDFTDVFLVFDLDPHDQKFDRDRLRRALELFDDPTERGMLYINYPMLESYRHLAGTDDETYLERRVPSDIGRRYKDLVDKESGRRLKDLPRYDRRMSEELMAMNLRKANRMLTGEPVLPDLGDFLEWDGLRIFDRQMELIDSEGMVEVLNTSLFIPAYLTPSRYLGNRAGM